MVEKGCFLFVCIARELAVHAEAGEITTDVMGVILDYGGSILIISLRMTVLLGDFFGFRRCDIYTLFLVLNFYAVDVSISLYTLALSVKQFPAVNIINMIWGGKYNNQKRPYISYSKVLARCVAI